MKLALLSMSVPIHLDGRQTRKAHTTSFVMPGKTSLWVVEGRISSWAEVSGSIFSSRTISSTFFSMSIGARDIVQGKRCVQS